MAVGLLGTDVQAEPSILDQLSGFLSTLFEQCPGNATKNVGSAGSTLFEQFPVNAAKNVQKKVPEWGPEKSSGIGRPAWGFGGSGPSLAQT